MNIIKQLKDANGNNIYPIAYVNGGVKIDLLWTNSRPATAMADNTKAEFDTTPYQFFLVVYISATDIAVSSWRYRTMLVPNESQVYQLVGWYGTGRSLRNIKSIDGTGVTFGPGGWYPNGGSESANNYCCMPYKIYGIKSSYVVPTVVQGLQYVEV